MRKFIQLLTAMMFVLTFANNAMAGVTNIVVETYERSLELCVGEVANLKVIASDTVGEITDFQYQWYYSATDIALSASGWTEISGATAYVFQLTNVLAETTIGNSGFYHCKVSYGLNYANSKKSGKIEVTVDSDLPSIGNVDAPTNICEGTALNISIESVTNADNKAWYRNDEFVGRGNAYNVSSASHTDGGVYVFVATNACGETSSPEYIVEVTELPQILVQPRPAALCGGDDLSFNVNASGDNLSYQWYYNGTEYNATNGSDTNDTLLIEGVQNDDTFLPAFSVQVSNLCATVTSNTVGTIISAEPDVVGHPLSNNVCSGTIVELSADATTSYPTDTITYTWYLNGNPMSEYTTNRISFEMDSAHMGEWRCAFTNGCGTVYSELARVTVMESPFVENQPIDVSVCAGDPFQLNTKIVGYMPITYTWFNDNGEGLQYTDVTLSGVDGVHTSILSANVANASHQHFYYCHATNQCGVVITDTVYVTINEQITIYRPDPNSHNFSACSGTDVEISLAENIYEGSTHLQADEFEDITFAWYKEGSTEIISDTHELVLANISDDEVGYYRCDVTNACGTETSDRFIVSVIESPVILVQPQDIDVCTGGDFSISLEADGDGLSYVWYRDGEMVGTNSNTYTNAAIEEYGGNYHCVISSDHDCQSVTSETITVTVSTSPAVISQPTPATMYLCEGESYELTMIAEGDGVNYQWYNNDAQLPGQTSNILHIESLALENDGIFLCKVYNACGEVFSEQANLTVNSAPEMTLGPNLDLCRGESVVLRPQSGDFNHYSWNFGTYGYTDSIFVNLSGTYILEVTDSAHGNCVARDTVVVSFHEYFDITLDTTPIVTCGEIVLDAGAGAAEYMWSTTETTSSITVGQSGNYMVTVDGEGYGCTTSVAVNVTIGDEIVINLGDDIVASEDSLVEIGVPAVFEAYRWNTGYTGPKLTIDGAEYGIGAHTFWLEVSAGACYAKDTIVITFIEGDFIEYVEMPTLNIYPNPASDFVNIASSNGEMAEIEVYDLTGRLVYIEKPETEYTTINIANLVDATYFVRIVYADGKASVGKLVIQK